LNHNDTTSTTYEDNLEQEDAKVTEETEIMTLRLTSFAQGAARGSKKGRRRQETITKQFETQRRRDHRDYDGRLNHHGTTSATYEGSYEGILEH
jgi:hypothetical protein